MLEQEATSSRRNKDSFVFIFYFGAAGFGAGAADGRVPGGGMGRVGGAEVCRVVVGGAGIGRVTGPPGAGVGVGFAVVGVAGVVGVVGRGVAAAWAFFRSFR